MSDQHAEVNPEVESMNGSFSTNGNDPGAIAGAFEANGSEPDLSFLDDLAKAMRTTAAAEQARDAELTEQRRQAHLDSIRAREALEAEDLRELAKEDVKGIDAWSDGEIKRIKLERERRIASRREQLQVRLEEHRMVIASEVEAVEAALASYRVETERFFDRLGSQTDPVEIARQAGTRPPFPALDQIGPEPTPASSAYQAPVQDGTRSHVRAGCDRRASKRSRPRSTVATTEPIEPAATDEAAATTAAPEESDVPETVEAVAPVEAVEAVDAAETAETAETEEIGGTGSRTGRGRGGASGRRWRRAARLLGAHRGHGPGDQPGSRRSRRGAQVWGRSTSRPASGPRSAPSSMPSKAQPRVARARRSPCRSVPRRAWSCRARPVAPGRGFAGRTAQSIGPTRAASRLQSGAWRRSSR